MALAEKLLASEFNRDGHAIVDHHTYVFLGDGCLMEGISHEAVALAGAWKLNKLVALYDDNGISIDGQVAPWFIDDTPQRFEACGWNVIRAVDGHDADAVSAAIAAAKNSADKPTLICCKTSIGKGSPNRANTAKAHGEPLGAEEIKLTREALGWSHAPFVIPKDVYAAWDAKDARKGRRSRLEHPVRRLQGRLPRTGQGIRAPHEGRAAQVVPPGGRGTPCRRSPHQGRDRGQPQGQPDRAGALHRRPARTAGWQRRPDRLQPDQHQVHAQPALGSGRQRGQERGRRGRPPHQLRRARIRHGRDHERRRAARRLTSPTAAPS